MRPPPAISRFYAYPVISMVSLAAIFVTAAVSFGKTEIDPFVVNSLAFEGEPWRLAASALPHGNLIHLLFNVYWLWILGTILEDELGHLSTLLVMVVLAAGSTAAQYAFSSGGIGLSGVGYGIVGFLAAARRINPGRFRDAMDTRTLQLFIGWFVLCIILTVLDVMPVANWAHGAGFVLGIPLAYVFLVGLPRNLLGVFITLVLCAAFVMGAWQFRDRVNLSSRAGEDDRQLAIHEIETKQYEDAVLHFERALALSPHDDNAWYNYGVALQNAQSHIGVAPIDAWRKALALAPKEDIYRNAVALAINRQAIEAHDRGDNAGAEKLYRESLAIKETGTASWNLGLVLTEEDRHDEAEKLFDRARQIDSELAKNHPPAKPDTIALPPVINIVPSTGSGSAPSGSAASGSGASAGLANSAGSAGSAGSASQATSGSAAP